MANIAVPCRNIFHCKCDGRHGDDLLELLNIFALRLPALLASSDLPLLLTHDSYGLIVYEEGGRLQGGDVHTHREVIYEGGFFAKLKLAGLLKILRRRFLLILRNAGLRLHLDCLSARAARWGVLCLVSEGLNAVLM